MTQTVPDISPLMPMHQDPLLVWLWYWTCGFIPYSDGPPTTQSSGHRLYRVLTCVAGETVIKKIRISFVVFFGKNLTKLYICYRNGSASRHTNKRLSCYFGMDRFPLMNWSEFLMVPGHDTQSTSDGPGEYQVTMGNIIPHYYHHGWSRFCHFNTGWFCKFLL